MKIEQYLQSAQTELDELIKKETINLVNKIIEDFNKLPLGLTEAKEISRFSISQQDSLILNYCIGINTIADLKQATIIKINVEVL